MFHRLPRVAPSAFIRGFTVRRLDETPPGMGVIRQTAVTLVRLLELLGVGDRKAVTGGRDLGRGTWRDGIDADQTLVVVEVGQEGLEIAESALNLLGHAVGGRRCYLRTKRRVGSNLNTRYIKSTEEGNIQ